MSPSFLILILLLYSIPAIASHRHIITLPSSISRPESFAWDPTAQHFAVGSSSSSIISSISDAGVAETIVSDSMIASLSSISIDDRRRRLLIGIRNPSSIVSYDLRSSRPHRRIFSSFLDASPGSIALDPSSGSVFVAGSDIGVIWRVDLEGNVSNFSSSEIYGGAGFSGAVHLSKGYLIVAEGKMGKFFRVDEDDGSVKEVICVNGTPGLGAQEIAAMADGTVVVAGGGGVKMVEGRNGWTELVEMGEVRMEKGRNCKGVGVRNGKRAYVLVTPEDEEDDLGSRIEEVEWEEEGDLLWLMVLVGFGLAYFLYWRFQMRQLISNMNKKRA